MAEYRFLTTWLLEAERLEEGDENGIGQYGRYVWKSRLPYELEFFVLTTRVERPRLLEGEASGELAGTGRWRLFADGGVTAVTYEWNVRTTRAWMNLIAPLARPVFAINHDWVMRNGGEGLARLLGGKLLASD